MMIRNRLLLLPLSALLFSGCQRETKPDPAVEALKEAQRELLSMREDLESAKKNLAEQETRLQEERKKMWAQLEEVGQTQVERQVEQAEREKELELRADHAEVREEVLAQWEQTLGVREQEVAGQDALVDWIPEEPEEFQEPVADFGLFYDELDDYGSWYESEDYGYVFQPLIVVQDLSWRPYTRGRWICTNYGWNWVSDEPFGWATYHYGRWCQMPNRGWCWVPGSQWAPSWCAWREGNGHVGWAPLPPESMAGRGRAWARGSDRELCIADDAFNFVESRHMANPAWQHRLPSGRNAYLRARTSDCTNLHDRGGRIIAGGPRWACVRAAVGRPWPVHELEFDPVGGLQAERARHGYAQGRAWRVFNPCVDAPWNLRLGPERVQGRVEAPPISPERRSDVWARHLQQTRQAQTARARAWIGQVGDGLAANRDAVATAQAAYRQRLVGMRQSLNSRPRQPLAVAREAVVVEQPPVAPSAPRANMPPALGRLLPPGVVPLPEAGRTAEESIVSRAQARPSRHRSVPVAEAVTPQVIAPPINEPNIVRGLGRPASTVREPLPQQALSRPGRPSRSTASANPTVSVDRTPAVAEDVSPNQPTAGISVPTIQSRQAQMREAMLRQQQAMRDAMIRQQQANNTARAQSRGRPTAQVPTPTPPRYQPTARAQGRVPSQPSVQPPTTNRQPTANPAPRPTPAVARPIPQVATPTPRRYQPKAGTHGRVQLQPRVQPTTTNRQPAASPAASRARGGRPSPPADGTAPSNATRGGRTR